MPRIPSRRIPVLSAQLIRLIHHTLQVGDFPVFECSDPFKACLSLPPLCPDPGSSGQFALPEAKRGLRMISPFSNRSTSSIAVILLSLIPHSRHMHHDIHRRDTMTPDRRKAGSLPAIGTMILQACASMSFTLFA